MLFEPLRLGPRTFPSNVVQGPLAGYSCPPFRRLFWRFGGLGFAMSEMISANQYLYAEMESPRYLSRDKDEQFCGFQITGNQPRALINLIAKLAPATPDLIDLNAGCPVRKIRRKQMGSKLLEHPELLQTLLQAIRDHCDSIVSLKIRLAYPDNDFSMDAVLEAAEKSGVDMLVVHGRHWTQRYDVACYHDGIAEVVSKTSIPVIANGDVDDYASLSKLYHDTQCAGVMISRASVGRPWLFQQLKAEHEGRHFSMPSHEMRAALFKDHLEGLVALDGERLAVYQARKLAKYYTREMCGAASFVESLQTIHDWCLLSETIDDFFNEKSLS
jgi:tRNA-dihydrouridine synthase B